MKTPETPQDVRILVVSDVTTDAEMVGKMLSGEFKQIATVKATEKAALAFERYNPDVLILAFDTLDKAEQYNEGLYRLSQMPQPMTHRSVILCGSEELSRAYDLCRREIFDDYVLFWPMVHDALRLAMSVVHAWRDLQQLKNAATATELVRMARRVSELEGLLKSQFEIGRLKAEAACLSIDHDVQPLKQWIDDAQVKLAPHLAATAALCELVEHFQPVVLVVDDNAFERKLVERMMEEEFYELLFADSGAQALSVLRKRQPDLILMDLDMPDINGLDTLRMIKASPQFASIPVMMVTGQSGKDMVVDCRKAGAVDFVVKPLDRDLFLKKVARLLKM
jgi:CheY-like chemotaxis protein